MLQCSTQCTVNDTLTSVADVVGRKRRQTELDTGVELPEEKFPRTVSVELTVINSLGKSRDVNLF